MNTTTTGARRAEHPPSSQHRHLGMSPSLVNKNLGTMGVSKNMPWFPLISFLHRSKLATSEQRVLQQCRNKGRPWLSSRPVLTPDSYSPHLWVPWPGCLHLPTTNSYASQKHVPPVPAGQPWDQCSSVLSVHSFSSRWTDSCGFHVPRSNASLKY